MLVTGRLCWSPLITLSYSEDRQQPMRQATPALQYVQTLERDLAGDMGVSVEASNASVPGDDQYHTNGAETVPLPPMDPYGPKRWIDIFSMGTNAFTWTISAAPFVHFSQTTGTLSPNASNSDIRIYVSIDWSACPPGSNTTVINITSSTNYGTQYSMPKINLPTIAPSCRQLSRPALSSLMPTSPWKQSTTPS